MPSSILLKHLHSFALVDPICQSDDEGCNDEFFDARSVAQSDSSFYSARFAASQADPAGCLSAVADPSLDDAAQFQTADPLTQVAPAPLEGGLDLVSRMNRLFDESPPVIVPRVYKIEPETEQQQRALRVSDDTVADAAAAPAFPAGDDAAPAPLGGKQDGPAKSKQPDDAARESDLGYDQRLPKAAAAFEADAKAPPAYLLRSDIVAYNVVVADAADSPRPRPTALAPSSPGDSAAIDLLIQELAQVAVDPQPEVAPSAAETVSPPEKRAIRTIEGIVKKMSDVCPVAAAAAVEDDLSVAESPLCGSALRKRKADIQVFPEDEGHWAPGAPGSRLPSILNEGSVTPPSPAPAAPASAPAAVKPGEVAVQLVVVSSSTPVKAAPAAVKAANLDSPLKLALAAASMEVQKGSLAPPPPLFSRGSQQQPKGVSGHIRALLKGCICPGGQKWEPAGPV